MQEKGNCEETNNNGKDQIRVKMLYVEKGTKKKCTAGKITQKWETGA